MAYSRGTYPDRQQRVAQGSQQIDQVSGTPLVLQGKDRSNPGQQTLDTRRPPAYLDRWTRFDALIANNFDQVHATPRPLVGKDALPVGGSTLDSRRPAHYLTRQSRLVATSQQYDQVHGTPNPLLGKDALPPGQSTLDTRRPAAFLLREFRYPVYDANSINGIIPENVAPDAGLPPGQSTFDTRPPAAFTKPPFRLATFDANTINAILPELFGQDAMATGEQWWELPPRSALRASDYTFAPPGSLCLTTLVQQFLPGLQVTDTLPSVYLAPARARDYTYTDASENWLFGTDAVTAGEQSFDLAPRAASRLGDYSWEQELIPVLVGQDAMVAGAQSFALPPIGALRARDYTFAPPINLCCLTTVVQQIPYGQQSTDSLPAHAALRARDYSWDQTLIPTLIGQDAMAAGAQRTELAPSPAPLRLRDYTFTASFPLTLISQDAMVAGDQSTALPPIGPQRARDYTFAPPINLPTLTTVVQQIPYGAQVTDSLSPHAALRAQDYTWTQDLIPNLIGQDAVNAGKQSFDLAPSPAPLRARDYSLAAAFPLVLVSQDAMTAGRQSFDLPPIAALRSRDYSFVPPANLPVLTTVVQPIPYGQQSTDNLPPRAPARARDYTHTDRFELELIGQDAMVVGSQWLHRPPYAAPRVATLYEPGVNLTIAITVVPLPAGAQSFELAPKAQPRARDYTHTDRFELELIGQDAMNAGDSTLASELPPKAAARSRDYTWLQSFPLYVYQQIPAGQSTQETEGPPKGPLRLRDYTHLDLTKRNLIGQDSMIVGDTTYASSLPPKPYLRAQNLTVPDVHNMMVLFTTARRNPDWDMTPPQSPWTAGVPGSPWTAGSLGSRWTTGPAKE